jgi:hypothetical protein
MIRVAFQRMHVRNLDNRQQGQKDEAHHRSDRECP